MKSAYITKEPVRGDQRLGYVIFKEKGVIEKFDPNGIKIDSKYTLGWSSYYHKNEKKGAKSKFQEKKNPYTSSYVNNTDCANPQKSILNKPKPQLHQHQMQLMILQQLNQPIVTTQKKSEQEICNQVAHNLVSNESTEESDVKKSILKHSTRPYEKAYFTSGQSERERNHCSWNICFVEHSSSKPWTVSPYQRLRYPHQAPSLHAYGYPIGWKSNSYY